MTRYMLSFDVEDWFHAHNLRPAVDRSDWEDCEPRVGRNTRAILELLDDHGTRATFFVLGWVAERFPGLVEEIDDRGHEVASHGYGHELLYELTDEQRREDLQRSLDILEPLVDGEIRGYRAPSFSITDRAAEQLSELGFEYDSSSFAAPVHDRYGELSTLAAGEGTFTAFQNGLREARLPLLEVAGLDVPWAGGGYFRFIPYPVFRRGVERIARTDNFIFYLHPWELDPDQPRHDLPLSNRIRHYTNLRKTRGRLDRLLSDFEWEPIEAALRDAEEEQQA